MKSTLVLNADHTPHDIVSARDGIRLILKDKAYSIDDSEYVVRTENAEMAVPYVIILKKYIYIAYNKNVAFSKRGVLVRDNFTCEYCGKYASTIDHVVPKSLGGKNTYENCVASCGKCNNKKSNKTLKDMGWVLNQNPKPPSAYMFLIHRIKTNKEFNNDWAKYLEKAN